VGSQQQGATALVPVAFFCKFHGPLGQNGQVLVSRTE
jgi:hypothetical protein